MLCAGVVLLGASRDPRLASRIQSVTTGLVAYWTLDTITAGTPSTTADSVGTNTATLNGTTGPTTAAGQIGNAFVFSAADSEYLSVVDATALNFGMTTDFTVALWAQPTDLANKLRVINKWDAVNNKGWLLDFNSDAGGANLGGAIRFRISDGTNNSPLVTAAGVLTSTTTWVHVAAVADRANGMLHLYVNGTEVGGSPFAIVNNATTTVDTTGISLGMGTIVNGLGNYYAGMLDDVRLYNRVLTPTEISALAQGFTGPPTAVGGLTATGGPGMVTLAWTTQGTQVLSYQIQRRPSGVGSFATINTIAPNSTGYVDTKTLNFGSPYDYQVVSVNPLGMATSSIVTATPTVPPPHQPGSQGWYQKHCGCAIGGTDPGRSLPAAMAVLALAVVFLRRR
jgi:MYXO-CTERM domain-containing protein